jgi:hypothetical protein
MQGEPLFTGEFSKGVFRLALLGGRTADCHHVFAALKQFFQNRFTKGLLAVQDNSHF